MFVSTSVSWTATELKLKAHYIFQIHFTFILLVLLLLSLIVLFNFLNTIKKYDQFVVVYLVFCNFFPRIMC